MSSPSLIAQNLAEIRSAEITVELYGDSADMAKAIREETASRLDALYESASAYRREQERQEAESKRIADEAAALAERQRAEREAQEAKEREQKAEAEKKQREDDERRAREFKPAFDDLVTIVANHYGEAPETATAWIFDAVDTERAQR